MAGAQKSAQEISGIAPDQIPFDDLFALKEPLIMRGLVATWPIVEAGRQSTEQAMELLANGYSGKPAKVYIGAPEINARYGYDATCTGLNYRVETTDLLDVFSSIRSGFEQAVHPYYYIPSLVYDEGFPGLQSENKLLFNHEIFKARPVTAKIWIGTESITGAHFDLPTNIACCAVGRRRFTLFPPEQVNNLYPGPFNLTPGGQLTSMVNLKDPDFESHPRAREALDASIVADLEPGDALYYPSMWWHDVEAKDSFNAMVNHWWYTSPRYMADPLDVLVCAVLGLRDRSDAEKQAWRKLFDYYIFGPSDLPRAHLPEACHGLLGELDETMARRLRASLQQTLNR